MPHTPTDAARAVDSMMASFGEFLKWLYEDIQYDKLDPLEDVDFDIADYVQHGPRLRGILVWRDYGKSTKFTCAYPCWRWMHDPQLRVKIISKSDTFAGDLGRQIKSWLRSVWFLQHLCPPSNIPEYRDGETKFDLTGSKPDKNPSLDTIGITGQITGTRAHILIPDDIEVEETTKTAEARDGLFRKTHEFERIASFESRFNTGGEIVVVGTVHHEDCVYPKLAGREKEPYDIRSWTMMLPPADGHFARGNMPVLAPFIRERIEIHEEEHGPIGENDIVPVKPIRFHHDKILAAQATGPINFAMQMMLMWNLGDGFSYLNVSDLIVPDFDFRDGIAPVWIKWGKRNDAAKSLQREDIESMAMGGSPFYKQIRFAEQSAPLANVKMRIDPSGGGPDETAYAIAGNLANYIWVMDVGGMAGKGSGGMYDGKDGSSLEVMQVLADRARAMNVKEITVESNWGQNMFAQLLTPIIQKLWIEPGDSRWPNRPDGWRCSVLCEPAGQGAKEKRILNALSGPMSQHRVIVHENALRPTKGLKREYELAYQLSVMTPTKEPNRKDDRAEVLANVVNDFVDDLDLSTERAEELVHEQALENIIRRRAEKNGLVVPNQSVISLT